MEFLKKILYKIKLRRYKKAKEDIKKKRQMILTLILKNIENENDLLKMLEELQYVVLSRLYYQEDKSNRSIFINDLLFIENYLKDINKGILLEGGEVQEKISDLMYYIYN